MNNFKNERSCETHNQSKYEEKGWSETHIINPHNTPYIHETEQRVEQLLTPSILCIDDEIIIGKTYKRMFKSKAPTKYCESAEDGLKEIYRLSPHSIVLSDSDMPHLNGEDIAKKSLDFRIKNHIAFIISSGNSNPQKTTHFKQMIDDGIIDYYLQKPISVSDILAIIDQLIGKNTGIK